MKQIQDGKMFIDGEWVDAHGKATYDVLNPGNGDVIARVPKGDREDAKRATDAAREAFNDGRWSELTASERSLTLLNLASLLEQESERIAKLESMNQGKTIKQSKDSDLTFAIDNIRFFAGAARTLPGSPATEFMSLGTSMVRREPLGVVACIVPWNYPLMIAIWKIAPALAAGNTVVVKPASNTPLTALELGKLASQAGVPKGVFNVLTGPGSTAGEELVSSTDVDMVSFTGDTSTGKRIMQLGSSNAKKVHLELGGKAPFIVFDDANLEAATEGAVVGGYINCGQDCTAATRIIVHEDVYDKFLERLVSKVKKIRLGDQLNKETDMGPLVSATHRDRVESYIRAGIDQEAKLLTGGKRPSGPTYEKGYYLEPTVFANVEQDMKVCREEIFGPVLTVLKFKDLDDAVTKANDVIYGLASSIWTTNITRAMNVAKRLRFGEVWINEHLALVSEMPHGGFKQSGSGKALSVYSLEEYTQTKHVYVDLTGAPRKNWYYTVYGEPD